MNLKVLGTLSIFALAACTHTAKNSGGFESAYNEAQYVPASYQIRTPAQSAPKAEWEASETVLKINTNGEFQGEVSVNQVLTWQELEAFQDVRNVEKEVQVPGTCDVVDCPTAGKGTGKWNNVFTDPTRAGRIKALQDSIMGIGEFYATALIKNGYFKTKPDSWKAFESEITDAASKRIIRNADATKILVTYKGENMMALGYQAENSCKIVGQKPCTIWQTALVEERFTNHRIVFRKKISDTRVYKIHASVKNAVLQPGEVDSLNIYVDKDGAVSYSSYGPYNSYAMTSQVSDKNIALQVTGTKRNLIGLSNNVVRQDEYKLIGGKPTFVLDIDPKFLPSAEDRNSQLVLSYEVQTCEYGGLFGTCGISSWVTQETKQQIITSERTIITLDLPLKTKSQLLYTLSRRASKFYNDEPTSQRETVEVKTPKR